MKNIKEERQLVVCANADELWIEVGLDIAAGRAGQDRILTFVDRALPTIRDHQFSNLTLTEAGKRWLHWGARAPNDGVREYAQQFKRILDQEYAPAAQPNSYALK